MTVLIIIDMEPAIQKVLMSLLKQFVDVCACVVKEMQLIYYEIMVHKLAKNSQMKPMNRKGDTLPIIRN